MATWVVAFFFFLVNYIHIQILLFNIYSLPSFIFLIIVLFIINGDVN